MLRLVWRFFTDPRVPLRRKVVALLPFLYVVLPFDLRPDWALVHGWFDDAIAILVGILILWWYIRSHQKSMNSRQQSADKTVEGEYRILK